MSGCCLDARELVIRIIWMAAQIFLGERAAGKRVRVKTCEQRERSKEECGEKWTGLLTEVSAVCYKLSSSASASMYYSQLWGLISESLHGILHLVKDNATPRARAY